MTDGRDEQGRFVKGLWKGGPGRNKKAREESYRHIFSETIPPEKFRASVFQAWLDSVGKRIDKKGNLVEDSKSTPATRANAFGRIAAYAMGKPDQAVVVDATAEGYDEIMAYLGSLSNDELEALIADADRTLDEYHQRQLQEGKKNE